MLISLLIYEIGLSLACYGGGTHGKKGNLMSVTNKKAWNGFNPPKGAKEAWENWMMFYNASQDDPDSTKKPNWQIIPGWPEDWQGLGSGYGGMPPPPWAYVPKNTGKPGYCYEPADPGTCKKSYKVYGFNPFTDRCEKFHYTGCGGNRNNFPSLAKCKEECIDIIVSVCNPNSHIPIS